MRRRERPRWRAGFLAGLALLIAGCARENQFERIAVLPFENQSGDARLDWISRGLAEAVVYQVTGSPRTHVLRVDSVREAPSVRPTHILHGYFSLYQGKLRVRAVLEDTSTRRMARTAAEAGPVDPLAAADAIAAGLGRRARPPATRNPAAFRAYVDGLAGDASAFERAVHADAGFGPAYLAWIQWLVARGDRDEARVVIASVRANISGKLDEIERARAELAAAILESGGAARSRALETLARLTPADAGVFQAIAANRLLAHDYAGAIAGLRRVLERDPENPAALNELAYAEAWAGDFEAAVQAGERYRQAQPREANPLDSLGDIHLLSGRFSEAEKFYLEAHRVSPAFLDGSELYKAAYARLIAGDVAGADALFARFLESRAGRDPLIEYRRADWEYLGGRRRQAVARLRDWAARKDTPAPAASLAWSQLAIWSLESGQRQQALECAARASALAGNPAAAALASACRFLAQPSAAAAVPDQVRAYGLILEKNFKEAARVLRGIYERTSPAAAQPIGVLLGWALVESGQDPGRLLAAYPLPEPGTEHPFLCLTFPRVLELRARWLERQGRAEEARADRERYRKLAGSG